MKTYTENELKVKTTEAFNAGYQHALDTKILNYKKDITKLSNMLKAMQKNYKY